MEQFIINIMNSWGYFGIFFLIMIENVFPPIPSELILTFGGFMTLSSNITVIGVIIASTIGSLIGAFILYYIGRLLDKERLIKIVTNKYFRWLRIKPKDIESADGWFDKKGNKTVFFCRFVPIVRSLISIPAGMSDMPIGKFTIYTVFGSLIWNTVLVLVGAYAGEKKDFILGIINEFSHIVLIAIVVLLIGFAIWYYRKDIKKLIKKSK